MTTKNTVNRGKTISIRRNTRRAYVCSKRAKPAMQKPPRLSEITKIARESQYPEIDLSRIDRSTGQLVDYDSLQPHMIRAGFLPAVAMHYYLKESKK